MVAVWTGPLSAPLLAVGGVVVDHVPPGVKDFGVRVFGVHDKTALVAGTAILLAVYAFGVGVLAVRHWAGAVVGIGLFAAIGVAAALTRNAAGVLAALPSLAGAALAVWVLRRLLELGGVEFGAVPAAPSHAAPAGGDEAGAPLEAPVAAAGGVS